MSLLQLFLSLPVCKVCPTCRSWDRKSSRIERRGVTLLCKHGTGLQARGHAGTQLWYSTVRRSSLHKSLKKRWCAERTTFHLLLGRQICNVSFVPPMIAVQGVLHGIWKTHGQGVWRTRELVYGRQCSSAFIIHRIELKIRSPTRDVTLPRPSSCSPLTGRKTLPSRLGPCP